MCTSLLSILRQRDHRQSETSSRILFNWYYPRFCVCFFCFLLSYEGRKYKKSKLWIQFTFISSTCLDSSLSRCFIHKDEKMHAFQVFWVPFSLLSPTLRNPGHVISQLPSMHPFHHGLCATGSGLVMKNSTAAFVNSQFPKEEMLSPAHLVLWGHRCGGHDSEVTYSHLTQSATTDEGRHKAFFCCCCWFGISREDFNRWWGEEGRQWSIVES